MDHGQTEQLAEDLRTQTIPVIVSFQQRRAQLLWEHLQLLAQAVWALDEACSLIRHTWHPARAPGTVQTFRSDDAAWARLRERPMRQLLRQPTASPTVAALHHALKAETRAMDEDPRLDPTAAMAVDPLFTALPERWHTHILRSLMAHDVTMAMNEGLTWHVAAWASQRQVYSLFLEYLLTHWTPGPEDGFAGQSPQAWVMARTQAWVTAAPPLASTRDTRLAELRDQLTSERAALMRATQAARGEVDDRIAANWLQMFHEGRYHFRPGSIRVGMTLSPPHRRATPVDAP